MATSVRGRIIQITNISPSCSLEQIRMLFGNIGVIEELVLYPPVGNDCPSKVCYIRYADAINAEVALHLHNTMFLDRALIVLPVVSEKDVIPDEKYANLVRAPLHTSAGIHPRSASWPLDVISMVVGRPGEQVIQTVDPRLTTLGFPVYPPLPAATDCNRIEEIRRTVLVTNLDPKVTGEEVLEYFNVHAEVKCVRMAGTDNERAAYVEFTEQTSILKAFGLMGGTIGDRQVMVQHSNCAIIKPTSSLPGLDDTVKRTSPPHNPQLSTSSRLRSRSRSRSRGHRSPSRSRRRRSRSRRGRSRSRSHRRHSRSRSRDKKRESRDRSRSRGRRSCRTRSTSNRRSSRRSRSRDRRRRSRDKRDRDRRDRHEKDRSRERVRHDRRSRSRHRRSRSRGKDRGSSRRRESVQKENKHDRQASISNSRDAKMSKERSTSRVSLENGQKAKKLKEQDEKTKDLESSPVAKELANGGPAGKEKSPISKKPVGVKLAGPEDDIEG
ncbi:splicing factor arginine:serine rich [Echinococcus multilocularis]|uniref:Splicing factor arginine:serine rich n=1 Tax=Echinococcus multilocularis TaxID=6211 RepID=A0A087VYE8_ECHMU|nr:splicing factor arginine:serine rich [Echinococcus multilocularis]